MHGHSLEHLVYQAILLVVGAEAEAQGRLRLNGVAQARNRESIPGAPGDTVSAEGIHHSHGEVLWRERVPQAVRLTELGPVEEDASDLVG